MTRRSVAFVFSMLCLATTAAAAEEPVEPYVQKFKEGRKLLTDNKFAEALEKFQESAALKQASGTLLNIGDCQEHLGRYASALSSFEQARALAAEEKKPEREKEAADRATKLQPLISSVTVKAPADAKIAIDGGPAEAGKPVSVDGGQHVVHAELKCKRPKDVPITVGNKSDAQTVKIDEASFDPDPACAPKPEESHLSTERMLSYVAGGAGVVALGFGIGFGLSASSQKSDLTDACPEYPLRCNINKKHELDDKYDSASTAATISTIGFVGAIALIGGGVALYILSPEWKQRQTTGRPFVPGRFYF
jgi:tetratricopeptide (TPR) repeat protein